jgi:hypothetical protein
MKLSVKQRQLNLFHIGFYYRAEIDGIRGKLYKRAIKSFQKDQKIKVDGIYGKVTNAALVQFVKDVQRALNKSGAKLIVDGIVGKQTITAIEKFQRKNKLHIDGIVGADTFKALEEKINKAVEAGIDWSKVKYFKKSEFVCGCEKKYCDGYPIDLDPVLIKVLERARETFGPIRITSGLRCTKYNSEVGGISNSKHKQGKAADTWIIGKKANNYQLVRWFLKQPEVSYSYTGFGAVHVDVK